MCITAVISLIIIGSLIAFSIITSITITGLMASYIIVITYMTHRCCQSEPLPPSQFSLGKYGLVINLIALTFLYLAFVMMFFLPAPHPTSKLMNWNIVVFSSVLVFSFIYYIF